MSGWWALITATLALALCLFGLMVWAVLTDPTDDDNEMTP